MADAQSVFDGFAVASVKEGAVPEEVMDHSGDPVLDDPIAHSRPKRRHPSIGWFVAMTT